MKAISVRESVIKQFITALKTRIFWRKCVSFIFFAFIIAIVLSACAEKIVYKEVLVPQICPVSEKTRPIYSKDIQKDLSNVLIYTELLEADLKVCRGQK